MTPAEIAVLSATLKYTTDSIKTRESAADALALVRRLSEVFDQGYRVEIVDARKRGRHP